MDGVLCDFIGGIKNLVGNNYKGKITQDIWNKIINEDGFWKNLKWEDGGKKIWNTIKDNNPIILTSPAGDIKKCKKDKKKWIRKNLGKNVIVKFEKNKGKYASPSRILIDDRKNNISSWEKKGKKIE